MAVLAVGFGLTSVPPALTVARAETAWSIVPPAVIPRESGGPASHGEARGSRPTGSPVEPANDVRRASTRTSSPGTVAVAEVTRADTLVLADGRTARLAGIVVPGTIEPAEAAAERIAETARALVTERVAAGPIRLGDAVTDRHGRLLAQVHDAAGGWLQEVLVAAGLVWVEPEG